MRNTSSLVGAWTSFLERLFEPKISIFPAVWLAHPLVLAEHLFPAIQWFEARIGIIEARVGAWARTRIKLAVQVVQLVLPALGQYLHPRRLGFLDNCESRPFNSHTVQLVIVLNFGDVDTGISGAGMSHHAMNALLARFLEEVVHGLAVMLWNAAKIHTRQVSRALME